METNMATPNYERYCSLQEDGTWKVSVPIRFTSMLLKNNKYRSLGCYPTKDDAILATKTFFSEQDRRPVMVGDYIMLWNRMEGDLDSVIQLRYKAMVDNYERQKGIEKEKIET